MGRAQIPWSKLRNSKIICSFYQVFLNIFGIPLPSYGILHSTPTPIYILVYQYFDLYQLVFLGCWMLIIIDSIPIFQKKHFILFGCHIYRSIFSSDSTTTTTFLEFSNTSASYTPMSTWTHLLMQLNSVSWNSSCFIKLHNCFLLVTILTSWLIIIIPLSSSHL